MKEGSVRIEGDFELVGCGVGDRCIKSAKYILPAFGQGQFRSFVSLHTFNSTIGTMSLYSLVQEREGTRGSSVEKSDGDVSQVSS